MRIDSGLIGECRSSCDVANAHVLLNRRIPYLEGVVASVRVVF